MAVRVGVIGAGPWGRNHIRIYSELAEVELAAVSDLNEDALKEIAEATGAKTTADYNDILNDDSIDCVSICVPAGLHMKVAEDALNAGKHILVEKPLALTSEDCEHLISLAEEKGLTLMVGQTFRFDPAIKKAKEIIASGELGRVHYVALARMGLKRPREDCGVIFNYAVHDFDIMCDVLGADYPKEITSISNKPLGRIYEDFAIVSARFDDDILAYSQVSWLPPKKIRDFWIVGEKKSMKVDTMNFEIELFNSGIMPHYDDFGSFRLITKSGDSEKPQIIGVEPLKEELRHFVECVRDGAEPLTPGAVGLRTVRMIEAALKSSETKKTVHLDEDGKVKE